jgi:hypothetical protein
MHMITLRARWPVLGCLFAALLAWAPCVYAQQQANPSRQNRQQRRMPSGGQNNSNSNSSQGNLNLGGLNLPFQIPSQNSNNKNNNSGSTNGNNSNNSNSQGGSGNKNGTNTNNNNNNSSGGATTQQQKQKDKEQGGTTNNLPPNKNGTSNNNTNGSTAGGMSPQQQKQQQQKDAERGKLPTNSPMSNNGGTANNNNSSNSNGNSNNNSKGHDSTGHKIGGIVIDALSTKYGYGGYGRYGYPNASYYNDYYSYVPTTAPPVDSPVVQPNVVRNVIVQKQGPLVRNSFRLPPLDKTAAAARTDAEQIAQIAALKQQSQSVIQGAVSAAGDPAMASDWAAYQQSPSTAGLAGFKEKLGAKLGPQNDGLLGATLRASKYQDDLMTGQLTSAQKDQSISEIEGLIGASLPTGPANAGMKQNLDRMRKLNALGKIVEAAQMGINAFPMLLQGAQSCGYPPSFVGQMVGVPYMDCPPMPDKPPGVSGKTCLLNSDSSGNVINYSLNEYPYSMGPGQSQFVDSGYVITFDSGSGATKRYTLADGSFRFSIGPQGWDMQSATFKVTIDNSNFGSDFNFAINNEPGSVRAGQAVQIQSPYPLEIMFDRGDGGEPGRKRLMEGIYLVGVDPGSQRLELFDVALLQQQQQPQQQNGMMPMMQQGGVDPAEAQRRAALIQEQLRVRIPPGAAGAPNMNNGAPFNGGPPLSNGPTFNSGPPSNNSPPPNAGTAEDALRRLQGQ